MSQNQGFQPHKPLQSAKTGYDWNPHPKIDFKAIAARVVAEEPYSKFTPPNP